MYTYSYGCLYNSEHEAKMENIDHILFIWLEMTSLQISPHLVTRKVTL